MSHAPSAQGFIPNLQAEGSVGISNMAEMKSLVERLEGAAASVATVATEGAVSINHAFQIEGTVQGLDQGELINSLGTAMSKTAEGTAKQQIGEAFANNDPYSDIAPPPTDVPRMNRPGTDTA